MSTTFFLDSFFPTPFFVVKLIELGFIDVVLLDEWTNCNSSVSFTFMAFTMPLVLDTNGNKFGKSEGNALWLDESKTSSYALYQYLINTEDEKVEEYLKVFTFLTPEEITDIMEKHNAEPHLRIGQKTLAREIITDLHGEESFNHALNLSEVLFSGDVSSLTANEIEEVFKGVPTFEVNEDKNILDFLVKYGILSSKREAREFITSGSITLNGVKVTDMDMIVSKNMAIESKYIVVRRGKKKYYLGSFNS